MSCVVLSLGVQLFDSNLPFLPEFVLATAESLEIGCYRVALQHCRLCYASRQMACIHVSDRLLWGPGSVWTFGGWHAYAGVLLHRIDPYPCQSPCWCAFMSAGLWCWFTTSMNPLAGVAEGVTADKRMCHRRLWPLPRMLSLWSGRLSPTVCWVCCCCGTGVFW